MKPVIAVAFMADDLSCNHLRKHYEQALLRAGAEVRWIEPEDPAEAAQLVLDCDGLLIPGGPDVEPGLYGQARSEKCGKANPYRDELEIRLLKAFLAARKPVFGVCRGIQIVNVFFGGTLHQDIGEIQRCRHSDRLCCRFGSHKVNITPGTILHGILGDTRVAVNSLHHQAVDTPAAGMEISAVSEDGIVEAMELTGYPFCLNVQWHPEMMAERYPAQQSLFDAFVSVCGKGMAQN